MFLRSRVLVTSVVVNLGVDVDRSLQDLVAWRVGCRGLRAVLKPRSYRSGRGARVARFPCLTERCVTGSICDEWAMGASRPVSTSLHVGYVQWMLWLSRIKLTLLRTGEMQVAAPPGADQKRK
jgi:hypothetical protein